MAVRGNTLSDLGGLFFRGGMELLQEAKSHLPDTIKYRRHFHRNPELSFKEVRSANFISSALADLGYQVQTGIGKTGVVGLIKGTSEKPVFMLRFDMDALPIQEETQVEYSSENSGVMHACGHDAHMAIGLTVAEMLRGHIQELPGTYKLVFQPAEEIGQGAAAMILDRVLENPRPDYALGVHVWNDYPCGWFGISEGPIMAGSDMFTVKIQGKGGHGAIPQLTADPVAASAQIITALHSIVSRNISPLESGVVSVTVVHGGVASNIIPASVELQGTIRSFTDKVRSTILERFKQIVSSTATAMGCVAEIEINQSTTPVFNAAPVVYAAQKSLKQLLPGAVLDSHYQTMGSEDMACFLDEIPGVFIFVGSANPREGKDFPHHHPKFDLDENCLPSASAVLIQTCIALAEETGTQA